MTADTRIKALAEFLGAGTDEKEISEADYMDNTFEHGSAEFLVLTEEEAYMAASACTG